MRGGKEVTLVPGQTFYEGPNDVHTGQKPLRLTNFRHKHVRTPISLKSANLPDGRRAKAAIRLPARRTASRARETMRLG